MIIFKLSAISFQQTIKKQRSAFSGQQEIKKQLSAISRQLSAYRLSFEIWLKAVC